MELLLVSTGQVGKAGDEWPLVVINRIPSSYLKAGHLILTRMKYLIGVYDL